MRILLTGSNGMLGSDLLKKLGETSHDILATGRGEDRTDISISHSNITYKELDILSLEAVVEATDSFKPQLIIHGAAMTQVDECEQNKTTCYATNVTGTDNLIAAADRVQARLMYISTDFVFSGKDGPYKEGDPTAPVNYYGETKELAECHVMESGLDWCIIRTILLYGKADPAKRSNFIYWVKNQLESGKQIKVVNDQIRTPTFIPDLTEGILLAIENHAAGIFHISGEEVMTPYEMAQRIAQYLDLNPSLMTPVDASVFSQAGRRPLKTGFIIDKAKSLLGYKPTRFEDSLKAIFPDGKSGTN